LRKGYQELVSLLNINTAIENAGKLEIYKLEKNVSMLATISGAGPMTGFRDSGGMIQAFHKMATAGGQIEGRTVRRYLHRNDDNKLFLVVGL
jgi:biopolymer transport protein ExbB/TolQ